MKNLTQKAIAEGFIKLLKKYPMAEITVKELVAECGINRKTFYYYYENISQLANDLFLDSIEDLRKSLVVGETSYIDGVKQYSNYMLENKQITLHVYKSLGYEKMTELFYNTSVEYFPFTIKNIPKCNNLSRKDLNKLSEYYAFFTSSLLTKWIKDGMQPIADEEFTILKNIMNGAFESAAVQLDR